MFKTDLRNNYTVTKTNNQLKTALNRLILLT